jgi:hypothetical protein
LSGSSRKCCHHQVLRLEVAFYINLVSTVCTNSGKIE